MKVDSTTQISLDGTLWLNFFDFLDKATTLFDRGKKKCTLEMWVIITMYLRIPAQVVIYGSWFPVLLFVLARVESSELHFVSQRVLLLLMKQLRAIYIFLSTMFPCHMRNVWVLCIAIKFVLLCLHVNDNISQVRKEFIDIVATFYP
ncbi:hypothetical protein THRCLA_10190 [Thraustotheca clavata]|uniref:Uncharacterized protein n=1 Tax=Thraustotheca clavata TaxID=74557 RepID=A0A1V9YS94_9STRA|nr:hypothetical protein THRCLA_10190 [Thraustotheca clavata]